MGDPYLGYGTEGDKIAQKNAGTYVIERLRELANRPGWVDGHPDWAAATALYKNFSRIYGREPNQSEINKLVPVYLQDVNLGNAYLEQEKGNFDRSPEQLAKKAPENFGAVTGSFKQFLNRDATKEEQEYFGKLLAQGEVDAYTLGQYLQQLPEYRQKKDDEFRGTLRGELEAADTRNYSENILPTIQSQFAEAGRSFDSSGFKNAAVQAARQQSLERDKYLAGLSADQYSGRTSTARADYENYLNRVYANQDYARGRTDSYADYYRNRADSIQDFNMQKAAYDDYLRRYGKRKSGLGGAIGGAIGGGIGAYFGGPQGAMAGYQMGGSLGNAAEGGFY